MSCNDDIFNSFVEIKNFSASETHITIETSHYTIWGDCSWRLIRDSEIFSSSEFNTQVSDTLTPAKIKAYDAGNDEEFSWKLLTDSNIIVELICMCPEDEISYSLE